MSTQLTPPSDEKAVVKAETKTPKPWTSQDAHEVGLPSPAAVNFMLSVANHLASSALYTPDMGGTLQQIQANALAKMLTGLELGLQPMEALRTLHIVKGKIGLPYDLMIARMLEQGIKIEWLQDNAEGCRVRGTRSDGLMSYEAFFGPEDAKRAGLAGGDNYLKRPRVMYRARASSELYRVIGGRGAAKTYSLEEMRDIEQEDSQPRTVESIEHKAGVDQPVPDETLIPPELESSLRDAAHQAGKQQAWAAAKLAEIQGKIKAAWIADTEATPEERNEWAAEMVKVAIEELQREQEAKPAKVLRVKKPTATEQAAAPPPPPVAEQQVEAPAPAPPEKEEEGFPSLW